MTKMEMEVLRDVSRAFTEDDQRVVLTQLRTELIQEELERRIDITKELLSAVYDTVYQAKCETLEESEAVIRTLRKILEGKQ